MDYDSLMAFWQDIHASASAKDLDMSSQSNNDGALLLGELTGCL